MVRSFGIPSSYTFPADSVYDWISRGSEAGARTELGLGPLELVYSHGIGAAPGQAGRLVVEPPSLNRVPTRVPPATHYTATARRLPTIENYNPRPANRPTVWLEPNEDWPEDTEGDIFAYVPHVG